MDSPPPWFRTLDSPLGFGVRVALFLGINLLLLGGIFTISPSSAPDQFNPLVSKNDRFLKLCDQKPVVLIGGSNLIFGISSEALTILTGRPTVNMGYALGTGIVQNLHQVSSLQKECPGSPGGSVIVLSLEYHHHNIPLAGEPNLYGNILWRHPGMLPYLSPPTLKSLLDGGLQGLGISLRYSLKQLERDAADDERANVYLPENYTEAGELREEIIAEPFSQFVEMFPLEGYGSTDGLIEAVNEFTMEQGALGNQVVVVYPPIPQGDLEHFSEWIATLHARLAVEFLPPILNIPYSYPKKFFFDTSYHVTSEGRRRRTLEMAVMLAPFLEADAP